MKNSELKSEAHNFARPTCDCCGEWETITTRHPFFMLGLFNALRGIGEEWECPNCGHVWEKEKRQNEKAKP